MEVVAFWNVIAGATLLQLFRVTTNWLASHVQPNTLPPAKSSSFLGLRFEIWIFTWKSLCFGQPMSVGRSNTWSELKRGKTTSINFHNWSWFLGKKVSRDGFYHWQINLRIGEGCGRGADNSSITIIEWFSFEETVCVCVCVCIIWGFFCPSGFRQLRNQ